MGQNETTLMRDSPGAEAGSEPADSHQSAGVVPSPPLAHSIERHVERYDGDGHLVQASCLDCGYVYEDDDQARVAPSVPGVVGQDLPQSGNEPKPDAAERPGTVYHETYEQWRVYHLLHGSLEARAQYTECLHCGATYWHQAGIPARPRARAQTTDAIDERLESYRTAQAARGLGLSQEADDLGWLLARVRELEGQLERET
jgi:hypothetical protein